MGISPTGKKLHIRMITIHRVANDDETIGAVHREDGDGDVTDGCDWLSVAEKASWHDREMVRPQLRTLNHLEDEEVSYSGSTQPIRKGVPQIVNAKVGVMA